VSGLAPKGRADARAHRLARRGWLAARHGWQVDAGHIPRAPGVLNALAMPANAVTAPGAGIIDQPPAVFDFAELIAENGRCIVENPLILRAGRHEMDFDGLGRVAAEPGRCS